jgi:hypothetical protein
MFHDIKKVVMFTKEKLDEIARAKKQIIEGSLIIWRTRLENLVNAGAASSIANFLKTPVEPQEANNCNCTNTAAGCGQPTESAQDFSSLPPPPGDDLPSVND